MITTVTLNAAIDKTYYLSDFSPGKVWRVRNMYALPGGKGINVARVVRQLGYDALATGFVGGGSGQFIEAELDKQGIAHDFVKVNGESRICLNIIRESDRSSTELLEPGPTIEPGDVERMKHKIRALAKRSQIVVFSGSIPDGAPQDIYAILIKEAKAQNAAVFLDTSGGPLLHGIEAGPYFLKPNEEEMQTIAGKTIVGESNICSGIIEWMGKGIAFMAVSLGARGCIAGCGGQLFRVRPPAIKAVNPVGSGDAFVAGMAVATLAGKSVEDCLRIAAAAGAANALTAHAGCVRPEDVERLLEQVQVTRI